jgi:hypothetical protein
MVQRTVGIVMIGDSLTADIVGVDGSVVEEKG